jgi:hypothetical protein
LFNKTAPNEVPVAGATERAGVKLVLEPLPEPVDGVDVGVDEAPETPVTDT